MKPARILFSFFPLANILKFLDEVWALLTTFELVLLWLWSASRDARSMSQKIKIPKMQKHIITLYAAM
jgi:hypothetical protein